MENFLYYDKETGEEFYVQAKDRYEADVIAHEYFVEPVFVRVDDNSTAELLGLDTY